MKYKAIIETDEFEDFEFFEDGNGKYIRGIDANAVNNEWIVLYFTECKPEPIIDKISADIRTKIVKRPWLNFEDRERDRNDAFLEVLDIIDKYRAESEDKNDKERSKFLFSKHG